LKYIMFNFVFYFVTIQLLHFVMAQNVTKEMMCFQLIVN